MNDNKYRWLAVFLSFLFFTRPVNAQTEKANQLKQQFLDFQSATLPEKIYVHTDRSFYLAGEIIWFKVYDVNGYNNKPMDLSAVCYLEILGRDQKPVLQSKIALKAGKGNGSFSIPSTMETGNYILRCYTGWMKNFPEDFYFEKQLSIVNTLKDSHPGGHLAKKSYNIRFFPEGGNLITGISCKLGFKAVDQNEEGVSCKGIILNQKNDTITQFTSMVFGMGNFRITPRNGEIYRAQVNFPDSVISLNLPIPQEKGYSMELQENERDSIKIVIHSNLVPVDPTVYLFVHSHQLMKMIQANTLSAIGETIFFIDKKMLGDGISHLTVFNADKQPVCERLYFMQPVKKITIKAATNQLEYSCRKKTGLFIQTTDRDGQPLLTDMSLAVFQLDSFQRLPQENILNYLLLQSDLKGKIESPQYYFENPGAETLQAADNLMLTQGWSRFRWEDVLANKKPFFEFLPEIEGPVIQGKIINKKTGLAAEHITAFLSIPGKNFIMGSAVSGLGGGIRFNVKNFSGRNDIILQTHPRSDSNFRVDINLPFSEKPAILRPGDLHLPNQWEKQLLDRSINSQVENTYRKGEKHKILLMEKNDSLAFFGIPDRQYNLDEYTRFPTMEEVIKEYVLDVHVRKQSDRYYYRVRNALFNVFFEDDPLLLLDGVPIFDADKLMALDPLKIRKVEVVARKYVFGSLVNDGIVSYRTYEGDLGGYPLDPNAVVVSWEGIQPLRELYTPVYEEGSISDKHLPDFRGLLAWMPALQSNTQGKLKLDFYTSDLTGKFAIVIQGISADGLLGTTVATFNVNP